MYLGYTFILFNIIYDSHNNTYHNEIMEIFKK